MDDAFADARARVTGGDRANSCMVATIAKTKGAEFVDCRLACNRLIVPLPPCPVVLRQKDLRPRAGIEVPRINEIDGEGGPSGPVPGRRGDREVAADAAVGEPADPERGGLACASCPVVSGFRAVQIRSSVRPRPKSYLQLRFSVRRAFAAGRSCSGTALIRRGKLRLMRVATSTACRRHAVADSNPHPPR